MSGADHGSVPPVTDVTGGAAGLEATYAEVRALADSFDRAGDRQRSWAGVGASVLSHPDLLASAPLAPLSFVAAQAAVLAATTGPTGLLPGSLGWEADAVLVRVAVDTLAASDDAVHAAFEVLDWRLGLAAGTALRIGGPVLLPAMLAAARALPPGAQAGLTAAAERWIVRHPGLVQHGFNAGGGLFSGLSPLPVVIPDNRMATGLLALVYGGGDAVTARRPDLEVPEGTRQPGSVAGLLAHLAEVAALSPDADSADNGTIEVQSLDPGTDHARHVVYLPGTDDLVVLPWDQGAVVRGTGTDLLSAAGGTTAYQRGILDAMASAGIGPHEPVLLVGHSLGGMEAAALAGRDTGFSITDVVTAGSPTAHLDRFPDGVRVLSLENRGDVVPLVDGADNPDTVQQTTVTFDAGGSTIAEAHGYRPYLAGAAAADASADPSVTAHLAGLHDRGFFEGARPAGQVSSQVFQISRAH